MAVVSAGNSGPRGNTKCWLNNWGTKSICSPGTARGAITVGASDKEDLLAGFSSVGYVEWIDNDGNLQVLLKPDIVAPGVNICAAKAFVFGEPSVDCFDSNHFSISGTSMAAPHISGVIALLLQKNPNWIPEEIKKILQNTAEDIDFGD